jgi:inward rectifier potassium channel
MSEIRKNQSDVGLSKSYDHETRRIINKDGTFNVTRKGVRNQGFQTLISMPIGRFLFWVSIAYLVINIAFAFVYLVLGTEHLQFAGKAGSFSPFLKALYFSMQTFTTVGFGSIIPLNDATNFVSGMQAMSGWMFFAVATGIIYSRFSKPTARLLFSDRALISPYEDGEALMFRVVNRRPNVLMEMEASVLLVMDVDKSEQVSRKFYNLDLETSSITFFPLSWTIVHPLQGTSPIKNIGIEELVKRKAEILILLKGFDETFGQNIRLRFSYTADEIVSNAKFIRNFEVTKNGQIELDIEAVHSFEKL